MQGRLITRLITNLQSAACRHDYNVGDMQIAVLPSHCVI